jgi:murein DD-endopeptidase MepM/ murein hydrolase activator NlpD
MKKYLFSSLLIPIFLSIFISVLAVPLTVYPNISLISTEFPLQNNKINNYFWPTCGYYYITSYYGNRKAPTDGASSFHGGIDIAAPYGSKIATVDDGIVTFTGWYGAGGYTVIILHNKNLVSMYCHVSPNFIVKKNDFVKAGDTIAEVGPKYINNIKGNPYKDQNGKPTNGATTGPHLHFAIILNGKKTDPLVIFD